MIAFEEASCMEVHFVAECISKTAVVGGEGWVEWWLNEGDGVI